MNVDCDGKGLTDDFLPTLPDKVVDVRMERNTVSEICVIFSLLRAIVNLSH